MQLLENFDELTGTTIVGTSPFTLEDATENCSYSFMLFVTEEHDILFFSIERYSMVDCVLHYMQANTFERYLFLKNGNVQSFLRDFDISQKEIERVIHTMLSRNSEQRAQLEAVQKKIRILHNKAEKIKDSWV